MTPQYYPDESGKWRWRLIARNGRIFAVSGESFASEYNAKRACGRMIELCYEAVVKAMLDTGIEPEEPEYAPV